MCAMGDTFGAGPQDLATSASGPELKRMRGRAGLSRRAAAASLGVHHKTLARYESGLRGVRPETLDALVALYSGSGPRERLIKQIADSPGITRRRLLGRRPGGADRLALEDLLSSGEVRTDEVVRVDARGRRYRDEGLFWGYVEPEVDREFGWIEDGEHLAYARNAQRLSQREMAARVKVQLKTYRRWERLSPPRGRIAQIADALAQLPNGDDLKTLRIGAGWTLEELAGWVGVSLSTVQRWENGAEVEETHRRGLILACEAMRSQQGAPFRELCGRIERYVRASKGTTIAAVLKQHVHAGRFRRVRRADVIEAISLGVATGVFEFQRSEIRDALGRRRRALTLQAVGSFDAPNGSRL